LYTSDIKISPGGIMAEQIENPIIVYGNGEIYIIDASELYDPFPGQQETEKEDSQELQRI
jgi:hypothetical protein